MPIIGNSQNVKLGADIDMAFLWRDAQVIQATGLENTFLVTISSWFYSYNDINEWLNINIDLELGFNQPISYKARYKKFFELDPVRIGYAGIEFDFPYLKIVCGNIFSPDNDLESEQILPPIAKSVADFSTLPEGQYYYNIISSKPRDVPILYDSAPFNLYDTGVLLGLNLSQFNINIYILNGEEGLDSNSDKYFGGEVVYTTVNKLFTVDLFIGVGKIGSIPFKSYSDKIKLNFKFSFYGIEIQSLFSIFRMGLTHENLNIFDDDIIVDLGFDGLPFEPYDIPNLYNYGEPLYGYGFFIQCKYENDFIIGRINFSLMDSDYRYKEEEIYRVKFRIYGDFGISFLNKTLIIRFGASYTYNPVFLLGDQLYHYWESIYAGDIDYRLYYYALYFRIDYRLLLEFEKNLS